MFRTIRLILSESVPILIITIVFPLIFLAQYTEAALPTFTEQTDIDFNINEDVLDVDMGDLNNDGKNDIAALTKTGSTYKVRIWQNTSLGGVATFNTSNVVYSTSYSLNKIVLANLNSSSNANTNNDIIVCANYDSANSNQQILIWKNPAKASATIFADNWNSGVPNALFGGGTANINDIEIGELDGDNGDNYVDIIVGRNDGKVYIWQNPETGSGQAYSAWSTSRDIYPSGLTNITCVSIGNIDGGVTAYKDVAVGYIPSGSSSKIAIFKNPEILIFGQSWSTNVLNLESSATTTTMTDVVINDINSDSSTFGDVIFTRGDSGTGQKSIVAKTNPGSVPFAGIGWGTIDIRQDSTTTGSNFFFSELALADFTPDANKYLDVVWVVDDNPDSIPRIEAKENTTGSAYANSSTILAAASGSIHAKTVVAGFLDESVSGNGKIDFAVGFMSDGGAGQEIRVWRNDSSATAVELAYFKAKPKKGKVVLKWKTKSEINNEMFSILRSENKNGFFKIICTEDAKGTNIKGVKYKCTDNDVVKGNKYFYKIEDVETYGTSNFSNVKKVKYR